MSRPLESTLDPADVRGALARGGHTMNVELDDTDFGGAIAGGRQFAGGAVLELALHDLGKYDVVVSGTTATPTQLLGDLERSLGSGGLGFAASFGWRFRLSDALAIVPRAGVLWSDSETELRSAAARLVLSDDSTDATAGLRVLWSVEGPWSVRFDLEHFALSGRHDVNAVTMGATFRLRER